MVSIGGADRLARFTMLETPDSAYTRRFALLAALLLPLLSGACQPVNPNANANANSMLANSNSNASNVNTAPETAERPIINTREPEKYSATLVFSLETEGGEKAIGVPTLSMQVARNGEDRRVEFKLPDGSPLVYLDHNNKHYVIAPGRKQYAELTQEATGIQLHKLLTPGQLVADLKSRKGVEPAGEGLINGRAAEKYRYATSTNTNTKAGEVKAEAFIYIDKETGLPLRVEMLAESSGDVKGIKSARVIAEMRDIKTELAATLFDVPPGFAQVAPDKIRQQIDALTGAIEAILKAMMSTKSSEPVTSPSAAASTKP
jgi:outer membrane lipoprotein-sorting protein